MGRNLWLGLVILCCQFISGCGGSSGESSLSSAQVAPAAPVNSDNARTNLSLSGRVSYDFIPHMNDHNGLDFARTEERPVRALLVELLNENEQVVAQTQTDSDGNYRFEVKPDQWVKVRVKAQFQNEGVWDFKVTDNTQNNLVYVLDGSLSSTGTTDSKRDLHAASGWDGNAYTSPRAAAPFAILDTIYDGVMDVLAAGNFPAWPAMEFRWSPKNSVADGDLSRGEIHTSFFDGSSIYLLGDADTDTDEYDRHVILHEWAHYLERSFFRSDSLGGSHWPGEILDIRVAMSEGFANAFAAMVLNDPQYADASGLGQQPGFKFSVDNADNGQNGYFNEGSISFILYSFYSQPLQRDMSPILKSLVSTAYKNTEAQTSIYAFKQALGNSFPELLGPLSDLFVSQFIYGADEYGSNEINSANSDFSLPVYQSLDANNPLHVCSSSEFGRPNKLTNSHLIALEIKEPGRYQLSLNNLQDISIQPQVLTAKPEFVVFQQGRKIFSAKNKLPNSNSLTVDLDRGHYVVEVYDVDNRNEQGLEADAKTACFNFQLALSGS